MITDCAAVNLIDETEGFAPAGLREGERTTSAKMRWLTGC